MILPSCFIKAVGPAKADPCLHTGFFCQKCIQGCKMIAAALFVFDHLCRKCFLPASAVFKADRPCIAVIFLHILEQFFQLLFLCLFFLCFALLYKFLNIFFKRALCCCLCGHCRLRSHHTKGQGRCKNRCCQLFSHLFSPRIAILFLSFCFCFLIFPETFLLYHVISAYFNK